LAVKNKLLALAFGVQKNWILRFDLEKGCGLHQCFASTFGNYCQTFKTKIW